MKKKIIIANWKARLSPREAQKLVSGYAALKVPDNYLVVACPDFLTINTASKEWQGKKIILGAQDCSVFSPSAQTGEIPASFLSGLGVKYVIIGHSERRAAGEKGRVIFNKIEAARAAKLIPVICVGENAAEKKAGKTMTVIKRQLKEALANKGVKEFLVAYEPVWAIGSGHSLNPGQAGKIHQAIRLFLEDYRLVPRAILYGGSVDVVNAQAFLAEKNIDGLLVGGASLRAKDFIKIIKA